VSPASALAAARRAHLCRVHPCRRVGAGV